MGFGPTSTNVPAGQPFTGTAGLYYPPSMMIGGVSVPLTFSGLIGAGIYQFTFVVPKLGSGDQLIQATINGNVITPPAYVAVQLRFKGSAAVACRRTYPTKPIWQGTRDVCEDSCRAAARRRSRDGGVRRRGDSSGTPASGHRISGRRGPARSVRRRRLSADAGLAGTDPRPPGARGQRRSPRERRQDSRDQRAKSVQKTARTRTAVVKTGRGRHNQKARETSRYLRPDLAPRRRSWSRSVYLQDWPTCIFWKQAYQSRVMIS